MMLFVVKRVNHGTNSTEQKIVIGGCADQERLAPVSSGEQPVSQSPRLTCLTLFTFDRAATTRQGKLYCYPALNAEKFRNFCQRQASSRKHARNHELQFFTFDI